MATEYFSIDDSDTVELEKDLKAFAHKAFPFAVRNTLMDTARIAHRFARQDANRQMTMRNKFTERSIRFDVSHTRRELNVSRMSASVGSDAEFMSRQEFGGTEIAKGKEGKPIYTAQSAGQGDSSNPTTKLPRAANSMRRISLKKKRYKAKSKRQALFFTAVQTLQDKNRFAFFDGEGGRGRGIYRIRGRINRKGSWKIKNLEMKLMWDMSKRSTVTPPNPWLEPASREAVALQPALYRRRLSEQLRRHGIA